MPQDNATVSRLRAIAQALEDQAGTTAPAALSRDPSIESQLRRIEDALPGALSSLVTTSLPTTVTFSIQDPDGIRTHAGRGTKSFAAWKNKTGHTLTMTSVQATTDADNFVFTLYKSASATDFSVAADVQLVAVDVQSDGTSGFTADVSTFDVATIEADTWLIYEYNSGTAEVLTVSITGTLS